jgi:quercetin dioxygenase-like cupin family protein
MALLAAALIGGFGAANAAEPGPTGNKGLKTAKSQIVDLGPEFPGMEGYQLRMRLLTIEPGGHIGVHSHKGRPSVVYFLHGTDIVTRADGTANTFKPGDVTGETKDTVHWHRNAGTDTVEFIAVDVLHKK